MSTLSKVIDNDQMQRIRSEFSRLKDRCYLENAGALLYPQCLIQLVQEDLMKNIYMNPHTDKYTKDCVEQIRSTILKHFNTDSTTYSVVFTSGTTQALKIVAESFDFASGENQVMNCGSFMYLRENHTSVLGLREIAVEKNADVVHISHDEFLSSLNLEDNSLLKNNTYKNDGNTLFAYPAESNFNGHKYPLDCIENIKSGCLNGYVKKHLCQVYTNWYILLDAACFVATNQLDLSKSQPDFICMSFYKVFGFPTGLGALLIKNSSANVLSQKKYFGGGTVDIVLSSEPFHMKRENLQERFEDGTPAFLSIVALKHCFDSLHSLIPKVINGNIMDTISYHTFFLGQDLYEQLKTLRHSNGNKAVIFYMDSDFTDINKQGGIVTFNVMREDGSYVGYAEFQHLADLFRVNIRTGCFCNSGSCQRHLKANNKEMKEMFKAGHKCGDDIDLINGKPTGAVRVSFAYYNTFDEVDALMNMICNCFVKSKFIKPTRKMHKNNKTSIKAFKDELNFEDKINLLNEKLQYNFRLIPQFHKSNGFVLNEIAIFPIKSCGAFKIKNNWRIGAKGFEFDREWMIIKENGVCLTQKQNSRMCLIRPVIDLDQRIMVLNFKGKSPMTVPLDMDSKDYKAISFCNSRVCSDSIEGIDCGDEAGDWISGAMEISFLRLIRQSSNDNRSQKKKGQSENDQKLLSLSNQAQFLLINRATVKWLSSKINDPTFTENVDQLTDRFRANIVIDTYEELIEKDWQRIIIGKHEFKVEGECPRCQMVCINQQTGEKTVEPLRTIAEQFRGKLRFGIYLSHVGTVDGTKDVIINNHVQVKPITADTNVKR